MPECNGLTVREAVEARRRLERMADGVAVVEDVAQLGLLLVALDHRCLDPARAGDDALEDGQVTVEQRGKASLEIREVRRVEHDAVLDHLGEPERYSRSDRVVRAAGSTITSRGWWNAPIRFLARG